jgi:16S rRNA processing protein RimM
MTAPAYLIVGRIRKPHGIRGEVIVEPLTDAPAAIFAAGRRVFPGDVDGNLSAASPALVVQRAQPFKDGYIVRFEGLDDRDAADLWRERYLLLPADELEAPGEGEVLLHELIGMHVATPAGERVGDIVGYYELPHGLMLEVEHGGRLALVPLREEFIDRVERDERRIVMELPDGLLD